MEVNYGYAMTAPRELADPFGRMYPPNVGYSWEIVGPLLETINISTLGLVLISEAISAYLRKEVM